ncbi:MAG: FAD-dependent oxidoreductase, partial [Candidatus Eisenbacteria bacterium]
TVTEWLDRVRHGPAARRAFATALTEAAINLPPAEADAGLLFAVVTRAFRGAATNAAVAVPRAGLAALLDPFVHLLAKRGGRACLGATVRGVARLDSGAGFLVELEGGESLAAERVVLALPAAFAHALVVRALPAAARRVEAEAATPSSPIVTVTLWFDRQVLDAPLLGLLAPPAGGGPGFHWAFDRGSLLPRTRAAWPVTLVASAAHELATQPTARVLERARAALELYGVTRLAPVAGRVVKEPHATPAYTPARAAMRPGVASGYAGLAFAGDWTATGLPATIEGAVVSGEAAARHVLGSAILRSTNPPPALDPEGPA